MFSSLLRKHCNLTYWTPVVCQNHIKHWECKEEGRSTVLSSGKAESDTGDQSASQCETPRQLLYHRHAPTAVDTSGRRQCFSWEVSERLGEQSYSMGIRQVLGTKFIEFLFSFWPHCAACGILVLWPGTEPAPPAVEVRSLNHQAESQVFNIKSWSLGFYTSNSKKSFKTQHTRGMSKANNDLLLILLLKPWKSV